MPSRRRRSAVHSNVKVGSAPRRRQQGGGETVMLVDLHAHWYPCYDYREALDRAWMHMSRWVDHEANQRPLVLVLAEGAEGRCFDGLLQGHYDETIYPWRPTSNPEPESMCLNDGEGRSLWMVRGRQMVSAERLEILALCTGDASMAELPAAEMLPAIHSARGVPMFSWAPGKWMGERGRILRTLLEDENSGAFLLGDSAMRPRCCLQPAAFQRALDLGRAIAAGSDPLPVPGEEHYMGSYLTNLSGCEERALPCQALRKELLAGRGWFSTTGFRCGWFESLRRWRAHRAAAARA